MTVHAPLDLLNPKSFRGEVDLGWNATGVIQNKLHFTGDEMIVQETMPAAYVQTCMDEVKRLSDQVKARRPGGHVAGRLPLPVWRMWRKQWENGPKQHGMLWRAFFHQKFYDRDYAKFRAGS